MSLNARQRRAKKRKLSLHALAVARNEPMVSQKGFIRSGHSQITEKAFPQERWTPKRRDSEPDDSRGRIGHVVKGKIVPPPKHGFRVDGYKVTPLTIREGDSKHREVRFVDTLRLAAAKAELLKKS